MNNKKGFTLIELLAVIVILAVIALIVTPIVTGIIDSAKDAANARSVEGHVKDVEYAILSLTMDTGITNTYDVSAAALNSAVTDKLAIQNPADKVKCGTYTIVNGNVTAATGCNDIAWGTGKKYKISQGSNAIKES